MASKLRVHSILLLTIVSFLLSLIITFHDVPITIDVFVQQEHTILMFINGKSSHLKSLVSDM